jgi:hypothetical protein
VFGPGFIGERERLTAREIMDRSVQGMRCIADDAGTAGHRCRIPHLYLTPATPRELSS